MPRTVQITRFLARLGKNVCYLCKETIPIGSIAVSCGRKKSLRYFHPECYESLFYDVSDTELEQLEDYLLLNGGID